MNTYVEIESDITPENLEAKVREYAHQVAAGQMGSMLFARRAFASTVGSLHNERRSQDCPPFRGMDRSGRHTRRFGLPVPSFPGHRRRRRCSASLTSGFGRC